MVELIYKEEVFAIVGAAMEVHTVLGSGFLSRCIKKRWKSNREPANCLLHRKRFYRFDTRNTSSKKNTSRI